VGGQRTGRAALTDGNGWVRVLLEDAVQAVCTDSFARADVANTSALGITVRSQRHLVRVPRATL